MMANESSHRELEELVALVVQRILSEASLSSTLAERVGKQVDCPPHTLCCSKNYICEGTGGFMCSPPYSCQNGFEERLVQRF
jgi:hypothetical protein